MSGLAHSWLFAVLFWTGISVGALFLVMLHHLSGGRWGFAVRRVWEAAMMPLPWMAVLFVPLLFHLDSLYPWARESMLAESEVLRHRQPYLNPAAFHLRWLVIFVFWMILATTLRRWSRRQDDTDGSASLRKLRTLSGPAMFALVISATFAYLDWILSLEEHFYSTIFMLLICVGQALSAYCLALVVAPRFGAIREKLDRKTCHQLGNLLLALVLLWTYLSLSQFIIIWMGDRPVEATWYLERVEHGWAWAAWAILALHFVFPFLVLLSRTAKKRVANLQRLAAVLLGAHLVFDAWLILPTAKGAHGLWFAFLTVPLAGVVWMLSFRRALKAAPLLVQNDPRLSPETS